MATFTSTAPLNMRWRDLSTGIVVEVVSVKASGIPWPANVPFAVPDAVADRFQSEMAAGPDEVPPRKRWPSGTWWLSPGPQPVRGRIPGLVRVS